MTNKSPNLLKTESREFTFKKDQSSGSQLPPYSPESTLPSVFKAKTTIADGAGDKEVKLN